MSTSYPTSIPRSSDETTKRDMIQVEVKLKYYATAREATGKGGEVVTLGTGSTVKELVRTLVELHGRPFSDLVLDQSGDLVDYLTYLIDGVNIHSLNGFETELRDGETVVIAPPIVGG